MDKPILIGLAGLKRTGKTTATEALQSLGFVHESFAAPIRELACSVFGLTLEQLDDRKEDPVGWLDKITPREFMQKCGTEFGRNMIHREVWLRSCMRRTSIALASYRSVVISDVRFENEAKLVRARGTLVHIRRPVMEASGDAHPSEAGVAQDARDTVLINDGSIAELHAKMINIAARARRNHQ